MHTIEYKEYRQDPKAIFANYLIYRVWLAIITYGILAVCDLLRFRNTKLTLGKESLQFTTGIIAAKTRKADYRQVKSFEVSQSSLGKRLSYGTVTILLNDETKIVFKFASHPNQIVKILENRAHSLGASAVNVKTEEEGWRSLVTGIVNDVSIKEVQASCREGERPKFIIGDGINGVLAAFEDRCIVIKKGAMTSFMSSSFGGGRTATFSYRDITGIEYNSGIVTGVLEILTASYSGKETNSPWQFGNTRSAHELSNTLPWDKRFYNKVRPQIEWMKHRIQESKDPSALIQSSSAPSLQELSKLYKQGVLSDREFAEAKSKLISKL